MNAQERYTVHAHTYLLRPTQYEIIDTTNGFVIATDTDCQNACTIARLASSRYESARLATIRANDAAWSNRQ